MLKVAQSAIGKVGRGKKFSSSDYRGKQLREHESKLEEKKLGSGSYAVAVYADAAKIGEHAVEIDLFKLYDIDRNGQLSATQVSGNRHCSLPFIASCCVCSLSFVT